MQWRAVWASVVFRISGKKKQQGSANMTDASICAEAFGLAQRVRRG